MHNSEINIKNISKIEGHASLNIKIKKNKVQEVNLAFTDAKRFFEQAMKGQSIETQPQSVSRICGTCSIAHIMGCITAIEDGLKIKPSTQTKLLRELTMYGLMIRDHALHLYFFSLPDIFKKDSILDFEGEEKTYLKDALEIKKVGNKLCSIVSGRAVHPSYPLVGGFAKMPNRKDLKKLISSLEKCRKKVLRIIDIYYNAKSDFPKKQTFSSQIGKFDFLSGKAPKEKKKTEFVGALARLNRNKSNLHKNTKKDASEYLKKFPSKDIFHNNLAQAIEILHCIDASIEIIEKNSFKKEKLIKIKPKNTIGTGRIEAPRGTLFYQLHLKSDGTIKKGKIITPTQHNHFNMEKDIKTFVQKNLNKFSKHDMEHEIEKLIRSYDPCISCASHFLKVRWE